jgi:lysozyme family protein
MMKMSDSLDTNALVTPTAFSDIFNYAFKIIVGEEGNYGNDSNDPGNWTGGAKNSGLLKGTKYGISAASYPSLDIANLTLDAAKEIYWTDYWLLAKCDSIPNMLAMTYFDSAVNQGVGEAVKLIQSAFKAIVDGDFGPKTKATVNHFCSTYGVNYATTLYLTERLHRYLSGLSSEYMNGAENRLYNIAICAAQYTGA